MKKIIITENQLKKLRQSISEQYNSDVTFEQTCRISFNHRGVNFKNNDIDSIGDVEARFTFQIEMEYRKYGIKDIYINNIQGPEEIELEIRYIDQNDNDTEEYITMPINWTDIIEERKYSEMGWIGIEESIEVDLQNDSNNNIVPIRAIVYVKDI